VVGVQAGRDDEAEAATHAEERVRLLQEQLVQIEIGGALMPKRVRAIREPAALRTCGAPAVVKFRVGAAPHDCEPVLGLLDKIGVAERERRVSNQIW
jgi:hypothetical protein